MITIQTGHYRFFTGDNVIYNNATTSWLLEQTTNANDLAMRSYAASGLMRALLDTSLQDRDTSTFFASVDWVRDVIIEVQSGKKVVAPALPNVRCFVDGLSPVNGVFDATSVAATKANKPHITAAIIDKYVPKTDSKLVIALGHGGILSSLSTYSALSGDNSFYPIRFSKYKAKDSSPILADAEREVLKELVQGRAVIVHDEDRAKEHGGTMQEAVDYINQSLDVSAYGVTPILARHPGLMCPQVIRKKPNEDVFTTNTYQSWSEKLKAILDEQPDLEQISW